jgi:hypothetical protein
MDLKVLSSLQNSNQSPETRSLFIGTTKVNIDFYFQSVNLKKTKLLVKNNRPNKKINHRLLFSVENINKIL